VSLADQNRDGVEALDPPINDLDMVFQTLFKSKRFRDMNCVPLFHGTAKSTIEKIARDGFKDIYASPSSWFGMGTYFTSELCQAMKYARADGCSHIFSKSRCGSHFCMCNPDANGMITQRLICSVVLLGKSYPAEGLMKGRKEPPAGYDSIVANHGINIGRDHYQEQEHREFVVFDGARAVPMFVLEYQYKCRRGYW
jgi:hypothetical protein